MMTKNLNQYVLISFAFFYVNITINKYECSAAPLFLNGLKCPPDPGTKRTSDIPH